VIRALTCGFAAFSDHFARPYGWFALDNAVTFTRTSWNGYTTLDRLGGYASSSDTSPGGRRTLCTTGDLVLVGGKRP
jgi:hypothetical protein